MLEPRPAPITVLQSIRAIRSTTNPYIVVLLDELSAHVTVRLFSWRQALFGRYDVLHVHWPELMFVRESTVRRLLHSGLFVLLLARLRLSRTPVVRTVHNLRPHESQARLTNGLLRLLDRQTRLWIRLNSATDVPSGADAVTIPHPHYRQWFANVPRSAQVPGRIAFFGQVRDYKNVVALLEAFRDLDDDDASLVLAGSAADPRLADRLSVLARRDDRVELRLQHVPDADLVDVITSSQLIVLPYREMLNSGAVLLALSLNRPVLVPDNPVTRDLDAEVGGGWVLRYSGELDASVLAQGLVDSARARRDDPALDSRAWPEVTKAHVVAFSEAIRLGRPSAADRGPVG